MSHTHWGHQKICYREKSNWHIPMTFICRLLLILNSEQYTCSQMLLWFDLRPHYILLSVHACIWRRSTAPEEYHLIWFTMELWPVLVTTTFDAGVSVFQGIGFAACVVHFKPFMSVRTLRTLSSSRWQRPPRVFIAVMQNILMNVMMIKSCCL